MHKLLAIDAESFVRRFLHTLPDADPAEKAEATLNSVYSAITRLVESQKPTHVLCAFDKPGTNWRHALHPAYRSHTEDLPAELLVKLPTLEEQLAGRGVTTVRIEGAEVADVLATAVMRWCRENRGEAVIATQDKRLHALMPYGVLIWDAFKGESRDGAWLEKKFGVPPEMLTDLLAICGDSDHAIPGVPGVGSKTAARLLSSYGDLDGIMNGAGVLLNPLGQKLRAGRDAAYLSRDLVGLKLDVQLGLTWRQLQWAP